MSNLATAFARLRRYPLGRAAFSRAVTLKAPYFASISPQFRELRPGLVEVFVRNRRKVHNHLGSVNAIAMCAMAELAAGTMMETSLPRGLRWIPRGMTVRYLSQGSSDLVARAELPQPLADDFQGDVVVPVRVRNTAGAVVMEADIAMYVSARKPKQRAA